MEIGRFTIEQLTEGKFEVFADGSINKLEHEEAEPEYSFATATSKSGVIGIDPILIRDQEHTILLDAGLGWGLDAGSDYTGVSNVVTNLSIFGLDASEVTHVILSHLHYDHSAGSTFTDKDARTRPTFPNARYVLHRDEWDYATSEEGRTQPSIGAGYRLDDLYRLYADGCLQLLDQQKSEVLPGITAIHTGGHTPGHLAVKISDDGESAFYLGDLLPSERHLNRYLMRQMDLHPREAKKQKIQLMGEACDQNACLLFYHSLHSKIGILSTDEDHNYVLKDWR